MTTSPLLQLIDAMNKCVEPEHHTRLMADALENAGMAEIPSDKSAFREFVSGPLNDAAKALLGDGPATELNWTLMRMTSVRAPSSRAPREPRVETVEYNEDAFVMRADVLVIDRDTKLLDELKVHLEARDLTVGHMVELAELALLTRDAPPRIVVTNVELDDGFWVAGELQRDLGAKAPRILCLTKTNDRPRPPKGVERVMGSRNMAPIVEAVLEMLGG